MRGDVDNDSVQLVIANDGAIVGALVGDVAHDDEGMEIHVRLSPLDDNQRVAVVRLAEEFGRLDTEEAWSALTSRFHLPLGAEELVSKGGSDATAE